MGETSFDKQVDKDWWRFKRGLAAHLSDARAPHTVRLGVISGAEDGSTAATQVRFVRDGDRTWCLLSLGVRPELATHTALLGVGFAPVRRQIGRRHEPLPGEYVDGIDRSTHLQASQLCVRATTALRELGVIHPAMLAVSVDGDQGGARSLVW